MLDTLRRWRADRALPTRARDAATRDCAGPGAADPGPARASAAILDWLRAAQDRGASADGGFARDYSLIDGWATSYPETSGYIVLTLLDAADDGHPDMTDRARRCLGWLVSIQFPKGGFQGGRAEQLPRVPVTFNTGQILIGLAAGAARLDRARYEGPMRRAAAFLRDSLDPDGAWRSHPAPFARPGDKAYETHISWGLFEAARVTPDENFGEAGLREVDWALTHQAGNGWFASNCLEDASAPLTHTIGYGSRGVIETSRGSGRANLITAARRTADGLLPATAPDRPLAGRLDGGWGGAVPWVCLRGSAQLAHCYLLLAPAGGGEPDLDAAPRRLLADVRRTVALDGPEGERGCVRGSFPVAGGYGRYSISIGRPSSRSPPTARFPARSCANGRSWRAPA